MINWVDLGVKADLLEYVDQVVEQVPDEKKRAWMNKGDELTDELVMAITDAEIENETDAWAKIASAFLDLDEYVQEAVAYLFRHYNVALPKELWQVAPSHMQELQAQIDDWEPSTDDGEPALAA
ncbi:hypothetical protein [Rhodoligotrophos defluvii]|uniref:hypothetical protein n=1 Tax=Rhodoligotrophos defluvii TaxID=2561934 RepID=UPI0010CA16B6|nr:hypothetical protein [Rhodoligotrophos defluvii]